MDADAYNLMGILAYHRQLRTTLSQQPRVGGGRAREPLLSKEEQAPWLRC